MPARCGKALVQQHRVDHRKEKEGRARHRCTDHAAHRADLAESVDDAQADCDRADHSHYNRRVAQREPKSTRHGRRGRREPVWLSETIRRVALSITEMWSASSPCRKPNVHARRHSVRKRGRWRKTIAATIHSNAFTASSAEISTQHRSNSVGRFPCSFCQLVIVQSPAVSLDVVLGWIDGDNSQGAPPSLSYIVAPRFGRLCAESSIRIRQKKSPFFGRQKKKEILLDPASFISVLQSILYALADPRVLAACFIIHRSKKDDPS